MAAEDFPDAEVSPETMATIEEMYANQARYRSTQKGAAILRTFPVLFVALLVVFIYTVYAMFHLIPLFELDLEPEKRQKSMFKKGVYEAVVFHIIFILFAISYILSVITPPGSIPNTPEWTEANVYLSSDDSPSVLEMKREAAGRRYCKWCMKFKPDRAHHCRQCRRCVLKMDHHCPWIYNCVGWGNHKYFVLTLIYASLCLLFVFATQLESVKSAIEEPQMRFGVVMLLLLSELFTGLFALICTCFFGFHWWLIVHNLSTIEFCEKHFRRSLRQNPYSRGCPKNCQDAFGWNPLLWCLPIDNRYGDGVHFESGESEETSQLSFLPEGSEPSMG